MSDDARPGVVAPRALLRPPFARLTHSVAQAIITATNTTLVFDTALANQGGMWLSTANTRLTCARPGIYQGFVALSFAAGVGTFRQAFVRLNGATSVGKDLRAPLAGNPTTLLVPLGRVFLAGDYLEVVVQHDHGANLNVNAAVEETPLFVLGWKGMGG